MRANNVLGIVYSNSYDESLSELTARRTMGSVPFGGRYRLIDFVLSDMVNSGICKVGVITNSNFRSLMDHIGNGKPWDLARKNGGLQMFPPFNPSQAGNGRIGALYRILSFISSSSEEYVLLSDTNTVTNMDFEQMFDYHTGTGADITILANSGKKPNLNNIMTLNCDADMRVTSVALAPKTADEVLYSTNTILMGRTLLERLVRDAESFGFDSFENDIIRKQVDKLNIRCYKARGFCATIDGLVSYYKTNLELLSPSVRRDLFCEDRPVYTKIRNDMPVIYGLGSNVSNSLVSDGCKIAGVVENSVLSRGVCVEKGAVVKNCILMQDTRVCEGASLNCVITDKSVTVNPFKTLCGESSFPVYVSKGIVI